MYVPGRGIRYLLVTVGTEHTCVVCTFGSPVKRYSGLLSGLKLWSFVGKVLASMIISVGSRSIFVSTKME